MFDIKLFTNSIQFWRFKWESSQSCFKIQCCIKQLLKKLQFVFWES